jgi:hypothetical protein
MSHWDKTSELSELTLDVCHEESCGDTWLSPFPRPPPPFLFHSQTLLIDIKFVEGVSASCVSGGCRECDGEGVFDEGQTGMDRL